jgi:hypothetical protein
MRESKLGKQAAGATGSLMDRRGFLIRGGSATLVVALGGAIGACADDDEPQVVVESGTVLYTSSVTEGHTHDFVIEVLELSSPPNAGVGRPTTVTEGHFHVVNLTQDELESIESGQVIAKNTSIVEGHFHTFLFNRTGSSGGAGTGGGAGTTGSAGTTGEAGTTGAAGTGTETGTGTGTGTGGY